MPIKPSCYKVKKAKRKTSNERGYNYKWQKARLVFLRLNPLCKYCSKDGIARVATVVDHIKPHKGNYDLFWDQDNWQPLCKQHHDIKTGEGG